MTNKQITNKSILVLTMSQSQSKYEVTRLEEEAQKMGIEVRKALYRDLRFRFDDGIRVFGLGKEVTIENTMAVWFRVAGTVSGKYVEGRNVLIRALREKGIFCCNHEGYLDWARMGKIAQHGIYGVSGIPVVPTRIYYKKEQVYLEIEKYGELKGLGWPIIAKHDRGFQGKSVRKFDNKEAALNWVKKMDEINLGMFLWQKCLPTRWDLRVIVLAGKAIGAMKRSAVGEEFRSNFSLGGSVEKWELSESDKVMAEKVAKVCGLDYCGVDIMKDELGNSYVLEVNRQCQYQGFEKATGINVAKQVVDMLIGGR
jgi:RimK family alpha-L-glutamate ligase